MRFLKIEHCFYPLAFLFLSLCYFSGSDYPRVWPDEVLFYSPAFELYKYDILRTPVLDGLIPGMSTHTLWMPPAFIYFVSAILEFISEDLSVVRFLTAVLGTGSIFLFSLIGKEMGLARIRIFLLQAILFTDFLLFKVSHSARMESLCFLFIALSMYLLLFKKVTGKNVSRIRSGFSGIFFGLALITHPFAISYSPVILLILFFRKQIDKNIIWFGLGALIPLGFWLSYALPNWEIFSIQFGAQLGRKKELLGIFTFIKKFKIIFSEFKFPWMKILCTSLVFSFAGYKIFKTNWKMEFIDKDFPIFSFSLLYTLNIFFFLIASSESWYVYHLVFPLSLLALSFDFDKKYDLVPAFVVLGYNVFVLMFFIGNNFIGTDMKNLTQAYYKNLDVLAGERKKIYLQAIPDPYFYFKKNRPNSELLEFIPGELPIDPNYYYKTIVNQDVYIFYNKDLILPVLKEYLEENKEEFSEEEIWIQTPKKADIDLRAHVFVRKNFQKIQGK